MGLIEDLYIGVMDFRFELSSSSSLIGSHFLDAPPTCMKTEMVFRQFPFDAQVRRE